MAHQLEIIEIVNETSESTSITFNVPASIKKDYKYLPGQYITVVLDINGEKLKRSYSISSCPYKDENLRIAVKRVKEGRVSNYINDNFKVGDEILVEKPNGNFKINTAFLKFKTYVFMAGGSGITPIMSMIQSVLLKEPFSKIVLLFGNQEEKDIIYKKQLDAIQQAHTDKFTLVHVLNNPPSNWNGAKGMLDKANSTKLLNQYVQKTDKAEYYICGPQAMMDQAVGALNELEVKKDKINLEYFTSPTTSAQTIVEEEVSDKSPKKVTLVINNKEHTIKVAWNQNIVEAAIRADLDIAYSCRAGVCSTCMGKLVSGKVHMNETHGLTEKDIEDGYVLTCQSHPRSNDIKIKLNN